MEETEKVFDHFWEQFSGRLKQCHSLRSFEESFNIVQVFHFSVFIKIFFCN